MSDHDQDSPKDPQPEAPPAESKTFTGYRRSRKTHWSIAFTDILARIVITLGGIGTIIAVGLMCLFLVWVVVPLFFAPSQETISAEERSWLSEMGTPVHVSLDEYNLMGWAAFADGQVVKFRIDNGEILDRVSLAEEGEKLTAWSFPQRGDMAIFGYEDGRIRRAEISFSLDFMQLEDAPEELRNLGEGDIATYGNKLAQMTPENQIRLVGLKVDMFKYVDTKVAQPVVRLDHSTEGRSPTFVALFADGQAQYHQYRMNNMTGKISDRTRNSSFELANNDLGLPDYVKLSGMGDNIYAIWKDGHLDRYDSRRRTAITLTETINLEQDGAQITAVQQVIGKNTLLIGDSNGDVWSFFRISAAAPEDFKRFSLQPLYESTEGDELLEKTLAAIGSQEAFFSHETPSFALGNDNLSLQQIAQFPSNGSGAVTSIISSQRKRMIAVGHADGKVRLHNVTNQRHLLDLETESGSSINRVVLSPRDNGVLATAGTNVQLWGIDAPHPEISTGALLGKMHYEGYSFPTYTWQSTGGTDDFESKLSLVPLIFGTLKATVFAMLFAVPIAIMAAIYTSEFLKPKMKAKIKPMIEMMASLPSVVLGFLAGLVVAQFIEDVVVGLLMAFVTVPFTFLFCSQIYQMLSSAQRLALIHWRFWILIPSLFVGLFLAMGLGPMVERALFWVEYPQTARVLADGTVAMDVEYSIRAWLSAHRQEWPGTGEVPQFHSSPVGGWMILFTPLSAMAALFLMARYVNPWLSRIGEKWSWTRFAMMDFIKFILGCLLSVVVAYIISSIVGTFWDARGSFIDEYVQRNALIVGMMMGFAVIPIIYTIADDAMSAVPETLRSASLGAGATPWQTAVRVILPTAMSGLFSACMIGFGRAIGETMIVLMAAGNTAIMEWNIFNGFRTLSANIAVEMSEAVVNSTNYRVLFLAGLTLFVITFFINTIAEMVRLHYRKKALEL